MFAPSLCAAPPAAAPPAMELQRCVRVVGVVVGVALLLALLMRLMNSSSAQTYSAEHLKRAKALVRQAISWHAAAKQDSSPLFASRDADYAVAFLNAARSMLPDQVLERLANVAVHDLVSELEAHQRECVRKLTQACPRANPSGSTSSANWISSAASG